MQRILKYPDGFSLTKRYQIANA